jgi:tetratricopeptide (TPR) repeat protein
MDERPLFPSYIPRGDEEERILEQVAQVKQDLRSRTVLLYGPGGVGKTLLVRHLAEAGTSDPSTVWVGPIDSDDSEFWLLSNLEQLIIDRLDPGNEHGYFEPYLAFLSRLPRFLGPGVGREAVIGHLGRIKRVFLDCYKHYLEESGNTVVMIFDTVEAIRGMDLLVTLTQLMKALPATLFVLSGRPPPDANVRPDPIRMQVEDPHQNIQLTTIPLADFTEESALDYLNASNIADSLSDQEKARLVRLTRGHPLWLAFTVSYLAEWGLPDEAARSLEYIEQVVPYRGLIPHAGQDLQESFNRRLVAPYRDSDFWHEAIKRLAVARESVSLSIWCQFMADRPLPDGIATVQDAWPILLKIPWIRSRANRHYVTLHDAVAEELAQRIIPMHDQDAQWRREVWRRMAEVYAQRVAAEEAEFANAAAAVEQLRPAGDPRPQPGSGNPRGTQGERQYITDVAALEVQQRELCQFKAVRLYYQILCDPAAGCRLFLDLLAEAIHEQDLLFQELLALEMERFLPGGADYAFGDVIGQIIDEFREWLNTEGQELYLEVGLHMADYLVRSEQPQLAVDMLNRLPLAVATSRQVYRLNILRGNAMMRIAGQVKQCREYFERALTTAQALDAPDRPKLIAKAHKELGFYYRNAGQIAEADKAYRNARDAISTILSVDSSSEDREEMASIQTNWAYVKGLDGSHREGINLVESAISVRQRLGRTLEEGSSWSVCGEIYRYERRFQMAWRAYASAEQIFQELRNWSWLGVIYQEQAICLFQAAKDGIVMNPGRDQYEQSKQLITLALDLCRDLAIRSYPSALNRAGRIYGQDNAEVGLAYLDMGITVARELSDGWFWFANLIEYVDLSYRLWEETRRPAYLEQIDSRAAEIGQAMAEYEFPDLKGRWNLIQGHLAIHEWLETNEDSLLGTALQRYKYGFAQLAQQHVGSSGATAVADEFRIFAALVWQLPDSVRAQWQEEFRKSWSSDVPGSTLLLARLEELY